MSKNLKKSISNILEYILLRVVQAVLSLLPRRIALRCGAALGMLLYHLGVYRHVVRANMRHVALWDEPTSQEITRKLYRNIGRYLVDFLRPPYPLPAYRLFGYEEVEPLLNDGKGTVVILGHIGNWEMLATVFGKKTGKLHVVAKAMRNAIVDRWLLAKRNKSSVTTIYSKQALRKMISALKRGDIIAILIDQYMQSHGNAIPFLGKEAMTVSTVAGIVLKTGCNVVSIETVMSDDGSYDIHVMKVPHDENSDRSDEERIKKLQTIHNDILSLQIQRHPDHWFGWFHRRFRKFVSYNRKNS